MTDWQKLHYTKGSNQAKTVIEGLMEALRPVHNLFVEWLSLEKKSLIYEKIIELFYEGPNAFHYARRESPEDIAAAAEKLDAWERGFDRSVVSILSLGNYRDFDTKEFWNTLRKAKETSCMIVRSPEPLTYEQACAQLGQGRTQ